MPTVQREVRRAEDAGIVVTERVGPARLVRANRDHPLFHALRQIVLATYGPPIVIAREFGEIEGTDAVLIFGSWAAFVVVTADPTVADDLPADTHHETHTISGTRP